MLAGGVIVAVMLITPGVDAQDNSQPDVASGPVTVAGTTQTQHLINYQGQLLDPNTGRPVANGNYAFQFRIYDAPTGGTILFGSAQNLQVTNGIFSTVLDLTGQSSIFRGGARWLGVQVGTNNEATPRQPVAYVPYAFWAREADTLDGFGNEAFARSDDRRFPIAFGVVNENGGRESGANFGSNLSTGNAYEISITNQNYNVNNFVTLVTPISQSGCGPLPISPATNSFNNRLLVEIYDRNGNTIRCKFHFAVFRP
jgi:hypothetical protein